MNRTQYLRMLWAVSVLLTVILLMGVHDEPLPLKASVFAVSLGIVILTFSRVATTLDDDNNSEGR